MGLEQGGIVWNEDKRLLFHPKLVEMVEQGRNNEITDEWVLENIGIEMYTVGARGLDIVWLDEGTAFEINEYDGAESLKTLSSLTLVA